VQRRVRRKTLYIYSRVTDILIILKEVVVVIHILFIRLLRQHFPLPASQRTTVSGGFVCWRESRERVGSESHTNKEYASTSLLPSGGVIRFKDDKHLLVQDPVSNGSRNEFRARLTTDIRDHQNPTKVVSPIVLEVSPRIGFPRVWFCNPTYRSYQPYQSVVGIKTLRRWSLNVCLTSFRNGDEGCYGSTKHRIEFYAFLFCVGQLCRG
jgi:hypothetical protein